MEGLVTVSGVEVPLVPTTWLYPKCAKCVYIVNIRLLGITKQSKRSRTEEIISEVSLPLDGTVYLCLGIIPKQS